MNFGDSVTTDHISPAGMISRNSPAARYLGSLGLASREFNSYGSRRGNVHVMSRGTFANIRLVNKFMSKSGPKTKHWPSGDEVRRLCRILLKISVEKALGINLFTFLS